MAITVSAAITDRGRAAFADETVRGTAFIVKFFDVGNGGHDVGNPIVALTPDTSLTELPGKTFGPEDIDESGLPNDLFTPEFLCILQQNEAVGELSNIGLLAKYTDSQENADAGFLQLDENGDIVPNSGQVFLFAIGNFPLRVKVDTEVVEFLVSIIF